MAARPSSRVVRRQTGGRTRSCPSRSTKVRRPILPPPRGLGLTGSPSRAGWATGTPPLKLIEPDNGNYSFPPAVSLGALWASADGNTLYQWGGQFQDNPDVPPPEARTFKYEIDKGEWSVVQTLGDDVGNPAEGQPAIVPGQGANGDHVAYCTSLPVSLCLTPA